MTDDRTSMGEAEPRRFRSPAYPFVALPKAIERAKSLHEKAHNREVGLDVLGDAWGYGLKSSGLVQTAAALMQFGLLVDRGSRVTRKFQLTPEAIRIVEDSDPRSKDHLAALQRAALRPKIFAELARKFSGRKVSYSVLKEHLTLGRREEGEALFSENVAKEVIAKYQATISFAGIDPQGNAASLSDKSRIASDKTLHEPDAYQNSSPGTGRQGEVAGGILMEGERVLQNGILGRHTSYRIIVRGEFGVKEIERLIAKLQLDREILADDEIAAGDDLNAQ